ncbi:MAG: SGNH/GDSL hydrolase family protein [Bacteroidota bacterium]
MTTRRNFFKQAGLAASLGLTFPQLFAASPEELAPEFPQDSQGVILFQGDSITDARRDRKSEDQPNQMYALGPGYAGVAASQALGKSPKANWQLYNRGISGHKVFQLAERWEKDCLALKPTVLSILIGVNDHWHSLSDRYDGTAAVYETDYRALLKRTKQALPDLKLIICEPFALTGGTAIKDEQWFPVFDGYRSASRRMAEEFDAVFVPFQEIFDKALEKAPVSYWCPDGVHPAPAGNYLMAKAWLAALKKVL